MNGQLVFAVKGSIYMDTSQTAQAFAKSRLADKLNETGYIASYSGSSWDFDKWSFKLTKEKSSLEAGITAAKDSILLEGLAFSGSTLKNYFDRDFSKQLTPSEKALVIKAASLVCTVIEEAVQQKIPLTAIGAGGIFIADDFSRVIFLPPELFTNCVSFAGDGIYSEYSGLYINAQLKGEAALRFTQSVIAYRALTNEFPFNNVDSQKRQEDIADKNFMPLRNKVWALDPKLSFFIDNSLQRSPKILSQSKKGTSLSDKITEDLKGSVNKGVEAVHFPLLDLYRELGLDKSGNFSATGELLPVIRKSAVSQEEFEAKAQKEEKKANRALCIKRWLRRYSTRVTVALASLLAIAFVTLTLFTGSLENFTTRGLTSFETVELFYSGINALHAGKASAAVKGSAGANLIDMVNNVFVAARTRSAYDPTEQTVSPAEWMNSNYDGNYNIFGLSQFTVSSTKGSLFFQGFKNKNHPKPITEEGGSTLKNGQTKTLQVSYFLVYNESHEDLYFSARQDSVTLVYTKGKWLITEVQQNIQPERKVDFAAFIADYKSTFEGRDKNPVVTANLLREAYPWISTNSEILDAANAKAAE